MDKFLDKLLNAFIVIFGIGVNLLPYVIGLLVLGVALWYLIDGGILVKIIQELSKEIRGVM